MIFSSPFQLVSKRRITDLSNPIVIGLSLTHFPIFVTSISDNESLYGSGLTVGQSPFRVRAGPESQSTRNYSMTSPILR